MLQVSDVYNDTQMKISEKYAQPFLLLLHVQ